LPGVNGKTNTSCQTQVVGVTGGSPAIVRNPQDIYRLNPNNPVSIAHFSKSHPDIPRTHNSAFK
jgi:hypothetical protein